MNQENLTQHNMIRTPAKTSASKRTRYAKRKVNASRAVIPSSYARSATVPRGVASNRTGFPKMLSMKHKYVTAYREQSLAASSVPSYFTWRANGMYDPDFTTAGHQPLYFDQMKTIYNHFTVLSSEIRVIATVASALNSGTGVSNICSAILYVDDDTNPDPSAIFGVGEQPSATHYQLLQHTNNTVFTAKFNARQAFGGNVMDNPSLRGNGSADPTEQQCFMFAYMPPPGMTCTVGFAVEIVYNAVWSELLPAPTS